MTTKYSALWTYQCGDRSANAISEYPETLMKLHEDHIKNPNSCWHNYKDIVEEIKVEPINCYTYKNITKTIEPYSDSDIASEHAFYAFNNTVTLRNDCSEEEDDDAFSKGEVLIYLSKTIHHLWEYHSEIYQKTKDKANFIMDPELPTIFYTHWPSNLPVEPDVYYEETIMNA
jgi:hypothetical protein